MKLDKMKLPDNLANNLQSVEKRWLNVQSTTVTFLSLTVFFLSLVVMYVSDRVWDTAPAFRAVLMVVTLVSFVTAVLSWLKRKSDYTRTPYKIIKMVQGHFSSLGDSLQGAVELSDDSIRPSNISPELCDAAINQVANKTSKIDFSESVQTSNRKRYTRFFSILAVVVVVFYMVEPRALVNSFQRWINPFSNQARYTFVELKDLPAEKIVLHGETFTLDVEVEGDSKIKPEEIFWNFKGLGKNSAKIVDGKVTLDLPGQTKSTVLTISSYDYKRTVKVIPVHRPAVEEIMANIKMPAYLKHKDLNFEVQGNSLQLIKGSTYSLTGKISNPLETAKVYNGLKDTFDQILALTGTSKVIDTDVLIAELAAKGDLGESLDVQVKDSSFSTAQLNPKENSNLLFTWKDVNNFTQKEPYEITVEAVEDEAPIVDCDNMGRAFALLVSENIIFPIKATDNFGVKFIKVEYEVQGNNNVNFSRSFTVDVSKGSESTKELRGQFIFSPNQMKIPAGSTVKLKAVTNDYLPGRKDVKSPEYKIYILSKEEHAKLIQERFEALTAKLEGVAMQEDENMQKNIMTTQMSPEDLNSEKGAEAIEEALDAEEANARRLKQLADEGMDLIKEALKNDEFEEEQLKEWTEMMDNMEELADEEMQDVQKSLAQAGGQPSSSNSQLRIEGLRAAIQKQEEILRQMRRLSKELDENMKKATLKNFAARLRNLSKQEKQSAGMLQQLFVQSVGQSFESLPEKLKTLNDKILKKQKNINLSIATIRQEIISFYARTKIDKYKEVTDDMEKEKVDEGLKKLVSLIEVNQTNSAIQPAKDWAKQFEKWAEILDPKPDDKNNQEEPQNPDQPREQDMEFLMALIRVIEQEQNIHEETLFLEDKKSRAKEDDETAKEEHGEGSKKLSERQGKNIDELKELTAQVKNPEVKELMEGAENAMDEAKRLLSKEDTGVKTSSAESAAVELLISIFNSSCKNCKNPAAMMAMMQRMQGQGQGNSPGGNPQGGAAEATTDVDGNANSDKAGKRDQKKHSVSMEEIPVEFREALESYYKEVEKTID